MKQQQFIPVTGLYKIDKSGQPWTKEENDKVVSHYPHVPKIEGRTRSAVKLRARYLGLRLPKEEAQRLIKKRFARIIKKEALHEKCLVEKYVHNKENWKGHGAQHYAKNRFTTLRDFSIDQDIKILRAWPEFPRITGRTNAQVEKRYKLLKKLKVTEADLKGMVR